MLFDIVIVSDFRFPGGTSTAIAHEIRALSSAGYKVGLVQKKAPLLRKDRDFHPHILASIMAGQAELIGPRHASAEIECKLAILQNPYVFVTHERKPRRISAGQAVLVAQQPVLDAKGDPYYDADAVQQTATDIVGGEVAWAPISPLSRSNMEEARLPWPILAEDWSHFVFVEDWACERSAPLGAKPVIGRHSRPDPEKWPSSRETMLAFYPAGREFDVRLLGIGDTAKRIMGTPLPRNWKTFQFGEIEPNEFLRSIHFFVYYHHEDWIEGFGRAVAEAAASGAVVLLPKYLEPTFGAAALYRDPSDVLSTIRLLHADWQGFEQQSKLGQRTVELRFGPQPYLDRVSRMIGAPESRRDRARSRAPSAASVQGRRRAPAAPKQSDHDWFDVVHIGDLRSLDDIPWRIANQTLIESEGGYATGFLHVPADAAGRLPVIHPFVDDLVRRGTATAIDPATPLVKSKLFMFHQPGALQKCVSRGATRLPRLIGGKALAFVGPSSPKALASQDAFLRSLVNDLSWAATTRSTYDALLGTTAIESRLELWSPGVSQTTHVERNYPPRASPVLGCVWAGPRTSSARFLRTLRNSLAHSEIELTVRLIDFPQNARQSVEAGLDGCQIIDSLTASASKAIANLDFLALISAAPLKGVPTEMIAWAMTKGVPPILPPYLEGVFGRGAIYARMPELCVVAAEIHADAGRMRSVQEKTARWAREKFSPAPYRSRLRSLAGPPKKLRSASARRPAHKRVLFISSNGVGLGHFTRLLAVARRMPGHVAPVFATMSSAASVIEQAGYPFEYLPFHVYANCDPDHWNLWLAEQLSQILDFHDPAAVVFDGSMPYRGLLSATAHRGDVKTAWIRRGMWQAQQSAEALQREVVFDLVIEPTEIAQQRDVGATARSRSAVFRVPPISLLDRSELYDRGEARARLGLDASRPAALVQLGSGWNRELATTIDVLVEAFSKRPELQPVIAEWLISGSALNLWPNAIRLRGFPITKYFNAFDFTISAAGYNSFNDSIAFGLPAVFIPNEHPMLDDQAGRALHAEENGAAFCVPRMQLGSIGARLDALLDDQAREAMKRNCSQLAQPNGAAQAADAIVRLIN